MKLDWKLRYTLAWHLKYLYQNSGARLFRIILRTILDESESEESLKKLLPELFHLVDTNDSYQVAEAKNLLGICFLHGLGTSKDEKQAAEDFKIAASYNYAPAQNYLAICYDIGIGIIKDQKHAISLYQLAADQGYALAQDNLGSCYEDKLVLGLSSLESLALAVKYYELSAQQGYAPAQMHLGCCLLKGVGLAKDEFRAADFFERAAYQGMPSAQYYLGSCYEQDPILRFNSERAVLLYRAAALQGHFEASQALIRIKSIGFRQVFFDLEQVFAYYQNIVNKKDVLFSIDYNTALSTLAFCHQMGLGTEINLKKAIDLYQQTINKSDDFKKCEWDLFACYRHQLESDEIGIKILLEFYSQLIESAQKGNARLAFLTAYLYENGAPGLDSSVIESSKFYKISRRDPHFCFSYSKSKIVHYFNLTCFLEEILYNRTTPYALIDYIFHDKYWKEFSRLLAENKSLTSLEITFNKMSPEISHIFSSALSRNLHLNTLQLSRNNMGDPGLKNLCESLILNRTLKTLVFKHDKISNIGAASIEAALKQNQGLTELILSENMIDDTGVRHIAAGLAANSHLKSLELGWNKIKDAGLHYLSEALLYNHSLTSLGLSNNQITGVLGDARGLKNALIHNRTLTYLDLASNEISYEGGEVIGQGLAQNAGLKELYLSKNTITSGAIGYALTQNRTLERLDLSYNSAFSDFAVRGISEGLAKNRNLTRLHLDGNDIWDLSAEKLSESLTHNKTLTELSMTSNNIGDAGCRAIAAALTYNPALTSLNLYSNNIKGSGAQALSDALTHNVTLKTLNLRFNKIGEQGFKSISQKFAFNRSLTSLDLESNGISTSLREIFDTLAHNHTLTALNLQYNRIFLITGTPFCLGRFANNRSLTSLNMDGELNHDALNQMKAVLERNTPGYKLCERMSLVMAFHSRLGADSALGAVSKDPIFDRKLVSLIFQYSGAASTSLVDGQAEAGSKRKSKRKHSVDSLFDANLRRG